jgi:hypothetical protein
VRLGFFVHSFLLVLYFLLSLELGGCRRKVAALSWKLESLSFMRELCFRVRIRIRVSVA